MLSRSTLGLNCVAISVLGLVALGCSDDTSQPDPDGSTSPDAAKPDQTVTKPDTGSDGVTTDGMAPDTVATPDTGPTVDTGPDIYNPNSYWEESSLKPANKLMDVYARSATEVYAVGLKGVIYKFDGTRWAAMTNPDTTNANLYTLHGYTGSTYVQAGGDAMYLYLTGGTWAKGGTLYSYASSMRAMWGPTGDTYMTGCGEMGYYMTYRSSSTPTASWSAISMGSTTLTVSLFGMWGYSTNNRYAVGESGTVFQCSSNNCYSSSYWSKASSGTTLHMRDVYGFYDTAKSKLDMFIVGFDGLVMHYDGSKFTRLNINTHSYFYGVWGTSPTDIWVVGHPYFKEDESVFHYDGTKFTKVAPPRTSYLNAVWGVSASQVYAVGNFNMISLKKKP